MITSKGRKKKEKAFGAKETDPVDNIGLRLALLPDERRGHWLFDYCQSNVDWIQDREH